MSDDTSPKLPYAPPHSDSAQDQAPLPPGHGDIPEAWQQWGQQPPPGAYPYPPQQWGQQPPPGAYPYPPQQWGQQPPPGAYPYSQQPWAQQQWPQPPPGMVGAQGYMVPVQQHALVPQRTVSPLLAIGIVMMPILALLTLQDGYSKNARNLALAWFGLNALASVFFTIVFMALMAAG